MFAGQRFGGGAGGRVCIAQRESKAGRPAALVSGRPETFSKVNGHADGHLCGPQKSADRSRHPDLLAIEIEWKSEVS